MKTNGIVFLYVSTVGELGNRTHISVRCSDHNVICQTRMMVRGAQWTLIMTPPYSLHYVVNSSEVSRHVKLRTTQVQGLRVTKLIYENV